MGKFKEQRYLPYLFLLPTLLVLLWITIFPFGYILYLSVHRYYLLKPWVPRIFLGVKNFVELFTDEMFKNTIVVTVSFTLISVALEFLVGLGLALIFTLNVKAERLIISLLIAPMVVAPVAAGLLWGSMYNAEFGIISYFLDRLFGVTGISLLGDVKTAFPSCVIVDVWQWSPFMFIILLAGLKSLPNAPFEAARIDGASTLQLFRYITLPILKPIILVVLLIRTIDAFKTFDTLYVLTGGGPASATETLSLYAYRVNFTYFNMGYGAVLALVLLIIIIGFCVMFNKLVSR